ncbi:galactokinase [Neobacillus sp. NPDC093127]|uniref:galactokinase n=1 Tax=Neobacillus sp. NPDC093127 TaxID=3364296 RepID=UPI00380289D4
MDINRLKVKFQEVFSAGEAAELRTFFSPGRINLIGEHTDYNGGHVFPCAITYGTYGIARKREDRQVRMFSMNFEDKGMIEFSLDMLRYDADHSWANYPKGMIRYLQEASREVPVGLDILIYGNIPNGAGLSSSASLEMLTGVIVNEIFEYQIDRIDLVKLGKKVENEFIGVNSGIMDQFAVGMGKENCGILLNCNTLEYEYVPLNLTGYKIIIMNTNKRRELSDSKYNERRSECEAALTLLQQERDIHSLGELSESDFETSRHLIDNETLVKRARHAVYENQRTLHASDALKKGNLEKFGQLMNASHVSLRDDYEVTGVELDTLVESAWEQEGTIGARMTGAGFGGCAIAIVKDENVEEFVANVSSQYMDKIGYQATFYVASIGEGAKELA